MKSRAKWSLEKSHALTEEVIARASTREQILLDEMKTEVAAVAREQASIKSEICGISRLQSHLQRKQDQIASKQDLLHSTIANEQRTTSSVMSSPLMSPPVPTWNHGVRTSIPEILPKSRNQSDLPMFSLQHTERDIQPPIVIDEELQSVLDDSSSIADATSTHSLSFNLPTATEDPPSIQDQHCRTVIPDQSGEIDSGLSTAASFHTNPKDRSGTALGAMANPDIYTENELFSHSWLQC